MKKDYKLIHWSDDFPPWDPPPPGVSINPDWWFQVRREVGLQHVLHEVYLPIWMRVC